MNVDITVTIDLSQQTLTMLRSLLGQVAQTRPDDLDERIEAAVGRAVRLIAWERDEAVEDAPKPAPLTEAVPVVPAVATAAPAPDLGPRWTAERRGILDLRYAAGEPLPAILARLNACPGPVVSYDQMKAQTVARRLKRPAAEPKPGAAATPALAELLVDDATIRSWAGPRGLSSGADPLDMARINSKRVELGLAPFTKKGRS